MGQYFEVQGKYMENGSEGPGHYLLSPWAGWIKIHKPEEQNAKSDRDQTPDDPGANPDPDQAVS